MYDYRNDIAVLLKQTQGTQESLNQTATMIEILLKLAKKIDSNNNEQLGENTNLDDKPDLPRIAKPTESNIEEQKSVSRQTELKTLNNVYHIKRLLTGAKVFDQNNREIAYYPESIIHSSDWHDGDIVELDTENLTNERPTILRLVPQNKNRDNVITFNHCIVKYNPSSLDYYVDCNYKGELLKEINVFIPEFIIPQQFIEEMNIKTDSIVDLAWYDNAPENIKIRWVYNDTENADKRKASAFYKRQNSESSSIVHTALDFDLENKKVAVIGADYRKDFYKVLIEAHNGNFKLIDGHHEKTNVNRYYSSQLADVDLAVIALNNIDHESKVGIQKALKQYQLKAAYSTNDGIQSIEQAIYRANAGLPAFESGQDLIEYPLK